MQAVRGISALEVIFNVMRSVSPRFTYLLTFLLTPYERSYGAVSSVGKPVLLPRLSTALAHSLIESSVNIKLGTIFLKVLLK